ncbi:hypothetical protein KAU11_10175 [Candidatus Babeliales bacterium]|nr:hypothetical protein [Candidatus Babeliales bacterium]
MGFLDRAIGFARRRCGEVSETELPSADIKDLLLSSVVREFSNLFPKRGEYTLALVDGQNLYDLPDPKILEIEDYSSISSLSSPYTGTVGSGYSNPAYTASYTSALTSVENVHIIGDKVEVVPTPSGGEIFLITYDMWDLADDDTAYDNIPNRLQDAFQFLLAAEIAGTVGNRRLKNPKIKIGEYNEVNLTEGAKALIRLVPEFKAKAQESAAVESAHFFIS